MKTSIFLEITAILVENPTQSEWRPIKFWVKVVWLFFQPPKQPPPPVQIPGYATEVIWKVFSLFYIAIVNLPKVIIVYILTKQE